MILEDRDKARSALRRRAMDLLARREHTRHELNNKLIAAIKRSQRRLVSRDSQNSQDQLLEQQQVNLTKNPQQNSKSNPQIDSEEHLLSSQRHEQMLAEVITEVLNKLEQDKLLSDSRFTKSYVNGRMNRGYGPLYIRHQLRQKQIDGTLLEDNLAQLDQEQWIEQLSVLIRRRWGETGLPHTGSKDYFKLQRFVLARGFTTSQWREVEKRFKSP